jgi:hypothetical protein
MKMKKLTARKLALGLSLAAITVAGTAYAEQAARAKRDADGNGVVTSAEAQTHAAAWFARMDANNDGKIDRADREARRSARFDRLDVDKNGQLSRAEFSARPQRGPDAMSQRGPEEGKRHRWGRRGHRGMMMGRMADANRDGAVTQAEFTAAARQRFERMDGNKDGQVTSEERQAAREAMRERWRNRAGGADTPAAPAN